MRISTQFVVVAIVAMLGASCAGTQVQKKAPVREQTNFSAEDEGVLHPVPITEEVFALLLQDKRVRNFLTPPNPTDPDAPKALTEEDLRKRCFSAAVVHLHGTKSNDLVVEGQGDLRGANVIPFWVFIDTPQGMKLAMHASEHDIFVENKRWHGYRTIEIASMNCCTIWRVWLRFDGKEYVKYREWMKDNK